MDKEFTGFLHNAPTVEKPAELQAYASGDGSLSFVYISDGKATGQRVTRAQAEQYLQDSFKDAADWTVQEINGQICLVRKFTRINGFTLKFNNRLYRYSVNLTTLGKHTEVAAHNLDVYVNNFSDYWDKVHNYNIIAAMKFFLNHEMELKE